MYAQFFTPDFERLNPFALAAQAGDLAKMKQLGQVLPQLELRRPSMQSRETPIHLAIKGGDFVEVIQYLHEELKQPIGTLSIEHAIRCDRPGIFNYMLSRVELNFDMLYKAALIHGKTSYIEILQQVDPEGSKKNFSTFIDAALSTCNVKSLSYLRRSKKVSLEEMKDAYSKGSQLEKGAIIQCETWIAREPVLLAVSKNKALSSIKPTLRRSIIEFI
mmetsp:Transcript_13541/g.25517  ORF Transcript_13541/g.25517 Transcript_13541/m.25517 type:complete len:218 (-) Transcript_13541:572-1225(-)